MLLAPYLLYQCEGVQREGIPPEFPNVDVVIRLRVVAGCCFVRIVNNDCPMGGLPGDEIVRIVKTGDCKNCAGGLPGARIVIIGNGNGPVAALCRI